MKKFMKKLIFTGITAVFFLTGCAQSQLPEQFDEETVKEEAMKAVELFNKRDYQSILDMGVDELKKSLTAEQFAQVSDPYLDKCGDFQEIEKTVTVGSENKQTGKQFGGVVMIGKYADGKIQFTIAFDENMKLAQFYIQ
jgi:hypothetical protein